MPMEMELVARARSADTSVRDAAFAELARTLSPTLLGLCLHVTGSRADAEDALQETWCAMASALHRFRGDCTLKTWAYRIALRASVRIKARTNRSVVELAELAAPDLSNLAEQREEATRTLAAMARLSAEQRAVLALFTEGLTHPEVADILGVPIGTLWSRLHLARKRLRTELTR
jgi:RNA polymerase sigma-70 factor (ECF subfamily)